jgi:Protein of unknown function (DUF2842)
MRNQPSWRIPVGVLALLLALAVYAAAVVWLVPPLIGSWHAAVQAVIYLLLGVVWVLPLRRFLIWMETGRWG